MLPPKSIYFAFLFMLGTAGETRGADAPATSSLLEAQLPNRSRRTMVHLGLPRPTTTLKSIGDARIKIIFVDFSDAVATRSPQSVFGLISPGAENLWKTISYGRMNPQFDPVFTWLRMSKRSDEYGWPKLTAATHKTYIQEAVDLGLAAGADFSSSDTVVILANPEARALTNGPTYVAGGIVAGNRTFSVAATSGRDLLHWGYKWLNHEGGHMMGLPDLYAFEGPGHRYVGDFSLMGFISGSGPEYFGWERWLLGWLDDEQVICAKPGNTLVKLAPIETAGGKKLVVIPTGATTAVVVESRCPLGLDTALAKAGPLAYFVDTSIDSGNGPLKVLPIDDNELRKRNAPLSVGQVLIYAGATVRFVAGDTDTVTLEVHRPLDHSLP